MLEALTVGRIDISGATARQPVRPGVGTRLRMQKRYITQIRRRAQLKTLRQSRTADRSDLLIHQGTCGNSGRPRRHADPYREIDALACEVDRT